jgi:hypothetical protein
MKHLVEFPLEGSKEVIFVEVEEDEEGNFTDASTLGEKIERASQTLEDSLQKIKPAAEAVIKKLKGLSQPPDEISVAFGLKLSADAGVILASSSIEANYTVTVLWRKDKPKPTTNRKARKSKK